jgi:diguanylate cyclase (GGDEF)-like protein
MIAKSLNGRRDGLRREWRSAFVLMLAALGLAMAGTTAAFVQVVGHYRAAASQLEHALALSSQLTDAITTHEAQAHALWNGAPIDPVLYQRQERGIIALFDEGRRDLHSAGQRKLLLQASQTWYDVLASRDLFGPSAKPRPGVSAEVQGTFAKDSDEVAGLLGTLSRRAIADGSRDLRVADSLRIVVIALLAGMFALVAGVTLYLARRMDVGVIRPLEVLQQAATRLREGELEYRVDLPARKRADELDGLAATFNDMANALHETHRNLSRQATHDALTGLPNRAAFHRYLDDHLGREKKARTSNVGVLFIDVDDFKFVNDSLGHAAGDAVLTGVAERLAACVRPDDVVARLGGDEFAILVANDTPTSASATAIATRIREALQAPFTIAGEEVSVAVSIGISGAHPDMEDAKRLLAEADFAMYTAKRDGKGRHEVFDATMRDAARTAGPAHHQPA